MTQCVTLAIQTHSCPSGDHGHQTTHQTTGIANTTSSSYTDLGLAIPCLLLSVVSPPASSPEQTMLATRPAPTRPASTDLCQRAERGGFTLRRCFERLAGRPSTLSITPLSVGSDDFQILSNREFMVFAGGRGGSRADGGLAMHLSGRWALVRCFWGVHTCRSLLGRLWVTPSALRGCY